MPLTKYAEKLIARKSGSLLTGRWEDRLTGHKVKVVDDNGATILCRWASGNMHEVRRVEFLGRFVKL